MTAGRVAALLLLLLLFISAPFAKAMTTIDDKILDSNGNVITLKGASWFGFNNGGTMVNGVWGGNDTIQTDFATIVYRWQLMGFNAVRLPFSFTDLYNGSPSNFKVSCQANTNVQVAASVVPSGVSPNYNNIPPPVAFPSEAPGWCNDYLPSGSVLNRYIWVVNYFAANGFYVLVDNHFREDQTAKNNNAQWLTWWQDLATKLSANPTTASRLMFDILNEPDNYGVMWPTLQTWYLNAMDRLYAANNQALFLIEGTGQAGISCNWGDGFCTDATLIQQSGLSDPNPFFQALMSKPYKDQVVLAPHVYGPSVTGASANYAGSGLFQRLSHSFGYLTKQGYTYNGVTKRFPVAIGEFGSAFTDSRDLQWLQDFATYLNGGGDSLHNPIPNWFYWSWNPNSGDTGGLVQNDWRTIQWTKVQFLNSNLGLLPWYDNNLVATSPPTTSPPTASPPTASPPTASPPTASPPTASPPTASPPTASPPTASPPTASPPTASPPTASPPTASPPTASPPTASPPVASPPPPTVSPPPPTVSPQPPTVSPPPPTLSPPPPISPPPIALPPPAATPPPAGNPGSIQCSVRVVVNPPWGVPGRYQSTINIYIVNTGTTTITAPYAITLVNPAYTGVSGYWNLGSVTVSGGQIAGTATFSWQNISPNNMNNPINVGYNVLASANTLNPTSALLNGQACTLTIG